jgi:hypothetical protein
MALELNGTTGVSLVQDGVVTAADLASTLDLTGKTVSLAAGGTGYGKVLQVVEDYSTSLTITTSTSYVSTSFSLAITPSSASSKILCLFTSVVETNNTAENARLQLTRDGTEIADARHETQGATGSSSVVMMKLDSPSTTSAVTYAVNIKSEAGQTVVLNRDNDLGSLVLMEIAA